MYESYDGLKPHRLETEPQARARTLGRQPHTPEVPTQEIPDLNLVGLGQVLEPIPPHQLGLVIRLHGPPAEPVLLPMGQLTFDERLYTIKGWAHCRGEVPQYPVLPQDVIQRQSIACIEGP